MNEKRKMVEPGSELPSVRKQCEILNLSRSTKYYEPAPTSADNLALMKVIDKLAMAHPYWGSRNVVLELRSQGFAVNRKRVQRLRRIMGIESLSPKPNLSKPNEAHKKYPYLLRGVSVERANQVWATDITYIPLLSGWAYLVAVMDWYSRKVLSWRLSNTLDTRFCVDALEEALGEYGQPEIFNSDQGVQFTSDDFVDVLKARDIRISMDGKGRWLDNVFVERLWRSVKYEEVYIHPCETMNEERDRLARYFPRYNGERRHQALGNDTADAVYSRSMWAQSQAQIAA